MSQVNEKVREHEEVCAILVRNGKVVKFVGEKQPSPKDMLFKKVK